MTAAWLSLLVAATSLVVAVLITARFDALAASVAARLRSEPQRISDATIQLGRVAAELESQLDRGDGSTGIAEPGEPSGAQEQR